MTEEEKKGEDGGEQNPSPEKTDGPQKGENDSSAVPDPLSKGEALLSKRDYLV